MPDVAGVELASIRQGMFAKDDLPGRVENELRTVAHDRGLSLLEPAATPAKASHPLGMLATGPVVGLSLDLTRLPLSVLKAVNVSSHRVAELVAGEIHPWRGPETLTRRAPHRRSMADPGAADPGDVAASGPSVAP